MSTNQNAGSSLIELTLFLPILMTLLHIFMFIGQGWHARNTNRLISRYVITHTMRGRTSPTLSDIQEMFALTNEETHRIVKHANGTKWKISQSLWLHHDYYLWRHQ